MDWNGILIYRYIQRGMLFQQGILEWILSFPRLWTGKPIWGQRKLHKGSSVKTNLLHDNVLSDQICISYIFSAPFWKTHYLQGPSLMDLAVFISEGMRRRNVFLHLWNSWQLLWIFRVGRAAATRQYWRIPPASWSLDMQSFQISSEAWGGERKRELFCISQPSVLLFCHLMGYFD